MQECRRVPYRSMSNRKSHTSHLSGHTSHDSNKAGHPSHFPSKHPFHIKPTAMAKTFKLPLWAKINHSSSSHVARELKGATQPYLCPSYPSQFTSWTSILSIHPMSKSHRCRAPSQLSTVSQQEAYPILIVQAHFDSSLRSFLHKLMEPRCMVEAVLIF